MTVGAHQSPPGAVLPGAMAGTPIRVMLDQKELELARLREESLRAMEDQLAARNSELTLLRAKLAQLKEDFQFNLSLLEERDRELQEYDLSAAGMQKELQHAEMRLSEATVALAETSSQLKVERRRCEDLESQFGMQAASLKEQLHNADLRRKEELLRQREEFESVKRDLTAQIHSRQEDLEQERRLIVERCEEVIRKKEAQLQERSDRLDVTTLEYERRIHQLEVELEAARGAAQVLVEKANTAEAGRQEAGKQLKAALWEWENMRRLDEARTADQAAEARRREEAWAKQAEEHERARGEMAAKVQELTNAHRVAEEDHLAAIARLEARHRDELAALEEQHGRAEASLAQAEEQARVRVAALTAKVDTLEGELASARLHQARTQDARERREREAQQAHDLEKQELKRALSEKEGQLQGISERVQDLEALLTERKEDVTKYKNLLLAESERAGVLQQKLAKHEGREQGAGASSGLQVDPVDQLLVSMLQQQRDEALAQAEDLRRVVASLQGEIWSKMRQQQQLQMRQRRHQQQQQQQQQGPFREQEGSEKHDASTGVEAGPSAHSERVADNDDNHAGSASEGTDSGSSGRGRSAREPPTVTSKGGEGRGRQRDEPSSDAGPHRAYRTDGKKRAADVTDAAQEHPEDQDARQAGTSAEATTEAGKGTVPSPSQTSSQPPTNGINGFRPPRLRLPPPAPGYTEPGSSGAAGGPRTGGAQTDRGSAASSPLQVLSPLPELNLFSPTLKLPGFAARMDRQQADAPALDVARSPPLSPSRRPTNPLADPASYMQLLEEENAELHKVAASLEGQNAVMRLAVAEMREQMEAMEEARRGESQAAAAAMGGAGMPPDTAVLLSLLQEERGVFQQEMHQLQRHLEILQGQAPAAVAATGDGARSSGGAPSAGTGLEELLFLRSRVNALMAEKEALRQEVYHLKLELRQAQLAAAAHHPAGMAGTASPAGAPFVPTQALGEREPPGVAAIPPTGLVLPVSGVAPVQAGWSAQVVPVDGIPLPPPGGAESLVHDPGTRVGDSTLLFDGPLAASHPGQAWPIRGVSTARWRQPGLTADGHEGFIPREEHSGLSAEAGLAAEVQQLRGLVRALQAQGATPVGLVAPAGSFAPAPLADLSGQGSLGAQPRQPGSAGGAPGMYSGDPGTLSSGIRGFDPHLGITSAGLGPSGSLPFDGAGHRGGVIPGISNSVGYRDPVAPGLGDELADARGQVAHLKAERTRLLEISNELRAALRERSPSSGAAPGDQDATMPTVDAAHREASLAYPGLWPAGPTPWAFPNTQGAHNRDGYKPAMGAGHDDEGSDGFPPRTDGNGAPNAAVYKAPHRAGGGLYEDTVTGASGANRSRSADDLRVRSNGDAVQDDARGGHPPMDFAPFPGRTEPLAVATGPPLYERRSVLSTGMILATGGIGGGGHGAGGSVGMRVGPAWLPPPPSSSSAVGDQGMTETVAVEDLPRRAMSSAPPGRAAWTSEGSLSRGVPVHGTPGMVGQGAPLGGAREPQPQQLQPPASRDGDPSTAAMLSNQDRPERDTNVVVAFADANGPSRPRSALARRDGELPRELQVTGAQAAMQRDRSAQAALLELQKKGTESQRQKRLAAANKNRVRNYNVKDDSSVEELGGQSQ